MSDGVVQRSSFFGPIYYPLSSLTSSQRSLKMPGYVPTPHQYPSAPLLALSQNGSLLQSFRFRPRKDLIDWRRFSAIDVDRVAYELDITTLQETISTVTFCNLDNEKCPHCQQPVDLVLLKVLKLAQLTIEYLLQCQEFLCNNVAQLEDQIQKAIGEHQKTKDDMIKQGEELRKVKEENKIRKKLFEAQQTVFKADANNYHKCQLCDKAFMTYYHLQEHHKRRHPENAEFEKQKKRQVDDIQEGIQELKNTLVKTQSHQETEREMEHQRRMQELEEARRKEENLIRDFERWKEEERAKLQNEMDRLRQQLVSQFEDIALKNTAKFQDMESKISVNSNLGELLDDEERQEKKRIQNELLNMREELEKQRTEWKRKMKEMKTGHNEEREDLISENKRLRASLSSDQKARDEQFESTVQRQQSTIKSQEKVIKSQEKKIRELNTSREFKEVPQVAQVILPVGGAKQEPNEESSDDDESLYQRMKKIETLRKDPNFAKQFRPILKQTLLEKLESMGVKKGSKGITSSIYKDLKSVLTKQYQQKVKKWPEIETERARMEKLLTKKVKKQNKNAEKDTLTASQLSTAIQSPRSLRFITSSGATEQVSNVRMVASSTPLPKGTAGQNMSRPISVSPRARTPPFTSEEDTSVLNRSPFPSPKPRKNVNSQALSMVQKEVEDISDDDWSDESDSSPAKPSPRTVSFSKDTAKQGSLVHSMARSLERQLSKQREKPFGGVETISSTLKSANASEIRKSQSWDDSDSEISSLEEITDNLDHSLRKPQPALRQSADSTGSHGTSIWSSTSAKGW
ncbi:zinc finger protein DZIP1L isoform X1 [Bufo bufo]|uniref:zinc finger protein DZIP1L isoform X1 n=2 Tax=Bufo bufo TaxID=8384 RepID=UPI001ABDAEE1|nr:zinc finger protein DZIP1L isoform X1 [Bufo bufo]